MKLLFDHHLSRRLVQRLADVFPDSSHVVFHGLAEAEDIQIWSFARRMGYTLVTKDSDFNDLVSLRGAPPKLIWLRIGNCTTNAIEQLLRQQSQTITAFLTEATDQILELIPHQ